VNVIINSCEWCSEKFETDYKTQKYCSRSHNEKARDFRKQQRNSIRGDQRSGYYCAIYPGRCIGCNSYFISKTKDKKYCSASCREWTRGCIKRDQQKDYVNQKGPSFKRRVYFASNGYCGICKELISLNEIYPSKQSFSIDHIQPRSLGGSHNFDNLQAAHLGCNVSKGNKVVKDLAT